jgi:YHS domain-containing protein
MNSSGVSMTLPAPGQVVQTACGGLVKFSPETPRSPYKGRWLYFCLPICQHNFHQDATSSCLSEETNGEN